MRCIVTGGAGFLGSHLTETLVAMGHSVAVKSPTFTMVEPYEIGDSVVFHFDLLVCNLDSRFNELIFIF